jgi:hypothetical protein
MGMMEKQVTRLIRHFGVQVHKMSGVLIATNGGGFAADYLRLLTADRRADGVPGVDLHLWLTAHR